MEIKGILNEGSTCYMNSILQVFKNLPSAYKFIISLNNDENKKLIQNIKGMKQEEFLKAQSVQEALQKFLHEYDDQSNRILTSKIITSTLGFTKMQFHEQEDADEFYLKMIDYLSKQIDEQQKSSYQKIFEGQKEEQLKCMQCQDIIKRKTQFSNIMIPLSDTQPFFYQAIQRINEQEVLQGCICDACGKQVTKEQYNIYKSLPDILEFTLQRFKYDMNYQLKKDNSQIIMPLLVDLTFQDFRKYYPDFDEKPQQFQAKFIRMLFQPWQYFAEQDGEVVITEDLLNVAQNSDNDIEETFEISQYITQCKEFNDHIIKYYKQQQILCFLNVAQCYNLDAYIPQDIFTKQNIPKDLYMMRMIVHHIGNAQGGHYYISKLEICDNQIACVQMNDLNISSIDDEGLLEQMGYYQENSIKGGIDTPYIYFYERYQNVIQQYREQFQKQIEIEKQCKQEQLNEQQQIKIEYLTNVIDGKTNIFGDNSVNQITITTNNTVEYLINNILTQDKFKQIQYQYFKIYAVKDMKDNIQSRHYKIFDSKEGNKNNMNIYQLLILSQQLNSKNICLYIEFNVKDVQDVYDEKCKYIKLEQISIKQEQFDMFNNQTYFNKQYSFKIQPTQHYLKIKKGQNINQLEVKQQINNIVKHQIPLIFGKTYQYPYITQINQNIDDSYSVIYYSYDVDNQKLDQFLKVQLYNVEEYKTKTFYVPFSFSDQEIKQQLMQKFNLINIKQIRTNYNLEKWQQTQQFSNIVNIPQILKYQIFQQIVFNFNNQQVINKLEEDQQVLYVIESITENKQDNKQQYKLCYKKQNKYTSKYEYIDVENIATINLTELLQYGNNFYIIPQSKFDTLCIKLYVVCEFLSYESDVIQTIQLKNKDITFEQLYKKYIKDYISEIPEFRYVDDWYLDKIVVNDQYQEKEVNIQDNVIGVKISNPELDIKFQIETGNE